MKIDIKLTKEDLDNYSLPKDIKIKPMDINKHTDKNWAYDTYPMKEFLQEHPRVYKRKIDISCVSYINPGNEVVIHKNKTWERVEDFKSRQIFEKIVSNFSGNIEYIGSGYVCGTHSPVGLMKGGLFSSSNHRGYEMWQQIKLIQ